VSNIGEADRPHPCERAIALVVENDPWIRLVMRDLLAQVGYGVLQASNGFSALRIALRERLALVLLDLVLPVHSAVPAPAARASAQRTCCLPPANHQQMVTAFHLVAGDYWSVSER
jgi:CheY-like chemotaxis protein